MFPIINKPSGEKELGHYADVIKTSPGSLGKGPTFICVWLLSD